MEDAAPHRMLDEIRESGETLAEACELFNANLEMNDSDDLLMFEDVIGVIDEHYEYGLIKFKNGDMVNEAGENEGSAKILSYAALSGMSKEMTVSKPLHMSLYFILRPDLHENKPLKPFVALSNITAQTVGSILSRGTC